MFARMLAEKGNKAGLPLIIVDMAIPGVADFISSISQECIVLFDEFEKIFREDSKDDEHPQEELLSLFDGVDSGKKLFVITFEREKTAFLEFRVYFNTGIIGTFNQWTNFDRDREDDTYVNFEKSVNMPKQIKSNTILAFKDRDIYFGEHGYYLDPKNVTLSFDSDVYLEKSYKSKEEKQAAIDYMNNLAIEKITIETHKEGYRNKGWGRFSAI